MFTGLIEETGQLRNIHDKSGKRYFTIACNKITESLKIGDSVACNGICLTVIEYRKEFITVEAMRETLQKTTAHNWKSGDKINLERAMQLGARLDGHMVQGHIDTTSILLKKEVTGETTYLWFELTEEYKGLVVPQGSIAINGVSLTIAKLESHRFAVALISHTLQETNLREIKTRVNIEFDIIGKYIIRNLSNQRNVMTMEWLRENNF